MPPAELIISVSCHLILDLIDIFTVRHQAESNTAVVTAYPVSHQYNQWPAFSEHDLCPKHQCFHMPFHLTRY